MLIGLVKWFDLEKGFGVIGTPNDGDFFLHKNSFATKTENIFRGTPILFFPKIDTRKSRNVAVNSRLIGNSEDWKIIFSYLGKSNSVIIEVETTGRGKAGNLYHRKEMQSFSLISVSLEYFLKDKSEEEMINFIIDYFNNDLPTKDFILYCEIIENNVKKQLKDEIANYFLNSVFSYFGKKINEEILFNVWKERKFKFIAYTGKDDYEIPENILESNKFEIGKPELNRIWHYSFGANFCSKFINRKIDAIDYFTTSNINDLYQFIKFGNEEEQETRRNRIDDFYAKQIIGELIEQANELSIIKNNDDFNNYNRLLQLIPKELGDKNKKIIRDKIYSIVASKCSKEFKIELCIKGIIEIEEVPFEFILTKFLDDDTQTEKQTFILSELKSDTQLELLKLYTTKYNYQKAFVLIENLVKEENKHGYHFNFSDVLFDTEFWSDKKYGELINLFNDYIDNEISEEQKYEMFFKGYTKNVPQRLIYQNINNIGESKCLKIFQSLPENKAFIKKILESKVITATSYDFEWLYKLANKFLGEEDFNSFDTKVFETVRQSEYFEYWKAGTAKIFPKNHIGEILKDNFENYTQIKTWIENDATRTDEITSFLLSYLSNQVSVEDRITFYKQINHIKCLLQLNDLNLGKIKLLQNDFYNIILWFLDKEDTLNFEHLKQKFIYFAPNEQIRVVRKLFFLKASGLFDLTVEKLNELTRFDLDLYKTNLNFNPEISVDISTDIVIKTLLSFKQNQRFFVESELLTVVLNDLELNKTKRFKLSNYFEKCLGREVTYYTFEKTIYRRNNRYTVKFPYSKATIESLKEHCGTTYRDADRANCYWDADSANWVVPNHNFKDIETFVKKHKFYFADYENGIVNKVFWDDHKKYYFSIKFEFDNELITLVKKISGAKWNPNEKHWGVPAIHEEQVLQFAFNNKFIINFDVDLQHRKNVNFYNFIRDDIPNGISFCEGRLANRQHEMFKKDFWWCGGQPCFSKCETIHPKVDWENYTLLDFCEILGFNTDETNKMGDYIPKGYYYQFIALINRFNRLLDKLYCNNCNHILSPSDFGTSHFAAHTIVRFQCKNEKCSNNDEIYLNHCLNGQCNSIIDSRISKRCDNGLFICDSCGSCCSHNMLERRLTNLKLTGGYIHENLIKCVTHKLGHLERAEYFCYKCNDEMIEIDDDIFQCRKCDVKYDTNKYKFKRPHLHLKSNKS
jgi:cold shock CspA family protein